MRPVREAKWFLLLAEPPGSRGEPGLWITGFSKGEQRWWMRRLTGRYIPNCHLGIVAFLCVNDRLWGSNTEFLNSLYGQRLNATIHLDWLKSSAWTWTNEPTQHVISKQHLFFHLIVYKQIILFNEKKGLPYKKCIKLWNSECIHFWFWQNVIFQTRLL